MKISSFLLLLLISTSSFAQTFKKGEGSEFEMMTQGQKISLSIYVSEVTNKELGIEFHFGSGQILVSNMWQQFQMGIDQSGPINIKSGFIKTKLDRPPEVMEKKDFNSNKGVQIQDFLFSDSASIQKDYIGDEKLELPSGVLIAKHYRKSTNGQTVDYWISKKVMPIGLVKLISKSKKVKVNNYTIELSSLLKNVKPAINPKNAIPMTSNTKKILSSAATQ